MTNRPTDALEGVLKEKVAYLTTNGRKTGKTHTVELWFATASGKIFLSHEGTYTDWMKNIERNSRVSIRIGSLNLNADSKIAEHGESRELGKRALYEKYYGPASGAVIDDWFELSTIIELTPLKYTFQQNHSSRSP